MADNNDASPFPEAPATTPQGADIKDTSNDDVTENQTRVRSKVWEELKKVKLPSGETKVECTYCKTLYKLSKTGSTSTLKRHLESCKKRTRAEKGQK